MPLDRYYQGNGADVMANMKRQYGDKKGEQVFYATAMARKNQTQNAGRVSHTRGRNAPRRPGPKMRKPGNAPVTRKYF